MKLPNDYSRCSGERGIDEAKSGDYAKLTTVLMEHLEN